VSLPRLLLAEDHELVGQGLKAMLSADYEVLGLVQDGADVVAAVRRRKPDVLLLDLSLPHRNGIDLLAELLKTNPELRVLVLTMHVDPHLASMAMSLGARGFVPKNAGLDELRTAIEVIREGGKYLSPKIPEKGRRGKLAGPMGFSQLTARQQSIVRMLGKGMSSEEIAEELGVTVHTVAFHRKTIRRALGVKTDAEMHRYAILAAMAEATARK
jgi:DNA-binding NarL/FixJ family response regulator